MAGRRPSTHHLSLSIGGAPVLGGGSTLLLVELESYFLFIFREIFASIYDFLYPFLFHPITTLYWWYAPWRLSGGSTLLLVDLESYFLIVSFRKILSD